MSQVATPPGQAATAGNAGTAASNGEKKKNVRTPYVQAEGTQAVKNEAGLLTEVPLDYSASHHLPPSKPHFASETLYWQFRVLQAEGVLERTKASLEICQKYGSPEQRKKKNRMERIRAELEALEAEFGVGG